MNNPQIDANKDNTHRYSLTKWWNRKNGYSSELLFILLNPPSANPEKDNPTTRRCIEFAKADIYEWDSICMMNLYSFCTPDQSELYLKEPSFDNSINDEMLDDIMEFRRVVVAWGNQPRAKKRIDYVVNNILKPNDAEMVCLGYTKHGFPRHPLMVKGGTKLQEYTHER